MKTIGLIGGLSWHSTATYYQRINEEVAARRGGHASARIALQSLDFAEIRACQENHDWDRAAELLAQAAARCEAGGADLVALCTNLMHKSFPALEEAVSVPVIHIADAVAAVAKREGWATVGILGARWVMEETFYADRLSSQGIASVVPDELDRELVDRVIFEEITLGRYLDQSRASYAAVIERLSDAGAEGVVLACTEIGLLMGPGPAAVPMVDSAAAHADLLVALALAADQAGDSALVSAARCDTSQAG
jgi:aspartate racemase